ncbi:InlB B-repeat-containing protein [Mycoplasmatota bacterium]|nr:InlB B-repeat-containing protein [Mycoplasmatota bacterium]
MKKLFFSLVLIFFIANLIINVSAASSYDFGGAGTETNPYIISKADDMIALSNEVEAGNDFSGIYFKAVGSVGTIQLNNFNPIGTSSNPFRGYFDGDGVTFDLDINRPGINYQGLFGYLDGGQVSDLSVSGTVIGNSYTAGIVGYQASGTIEKVYNLANVEGESFVGGISGRTQYGNIRESYNNGDIKGSASYVGGITGYIYGSTNASLRVNITNTYNRGEILGNQYVGGLVGYERYSYRDYLSIISYSYSAGLVSGNSNVGGVIGYYNTSGNNYNRQTHIYYDMSVIAMYDQPLKLKPAYITHPFGVKSDFMLFADGLYSKLNNTIWDFRSASETEGYFPLLTYFSDHGSSRVKTDALSSVKTDISYGLGTAAYPFLIKTAEDMFELSRKVSEGNTYLGYYFKVDDGVDELILEGFTPIGSSSNSFQGKFDGNGVNFKVHIENEALNQQGLFGYITDRTAIVKNFSITGLIKGSQYVGSAVGYLHLGTVSDIYNEATIIGGSSHVGGIVGYVYGVENQPATITRTYNMGEVIGYSHVGGILGSERYDYREKVSILTYSYSGGTVQATSGSNAGGVIGSFTRSSNNYNTRTHLYYDITKIVNYDKAANTKPSTDPVTAYNIYGITSGQMVGDYLTTRLTSGFVFKEKADGYGYYPQLDVFANSENASIKANSLDSVKLYIGDGLGTEDLPFLIRTNNDLETLKTKLEAGNTFEGFFFLVDEGIDAFDLGNFTPIGTNTHPFYGSFDGNDAVFNLAIDRTEDYNGLFGYFGIGTIKNLSVTGSVKGGSYTAGIVGYQASGTIERVYNLANVEGESFVGGISGRTQYGNIRESYNNGDIKGSASYVGGITGYIYGSTNASLRVNITNTYNRGEILGNQYVGGLVGYERYSYRDYLSIISYSYSAGLVSGNSNVGGVIGYYNTSGNNYNRQTHIYYDMSVIAMYDQPLKLKPAYITHQFGISTGPFIYNDSPITNFSPSYWTSKPKDGVNAYYPQLNVFLQNENQRIKNSSLDSTIVNVGAGLGTAAYPFLIKTAEDMFELSRKVSEGNTYLGYYFKVDDGVDELILEGFTPIGSSSNSFQGKFDGNGVNFKVHIENEALNQQGLFGYITDRTAIVKNFSITGLIKGSQYVGSAVGYLHLGTVSDIYNEATIIGGSSHVGGIVGYVYGVENQPATITRTYNMGEVIGYSHVGGILGSERYDYREKVSILTYSYSGGTVQATSGSNAGGVIGSFTRSSNNYNTRTHLYYDITKIVNYDKAANTKPSTDPVTAYNIYGITSGQMVGDYLTTRLTSGFVFKEKADGYGYYPQLDVFANSENASIKANSLDSVKLYIGDGLGTEDLPFLIRTNNDLETLKTKLEAGNTFEGFFFLVDEGIDAFDLGNFTPIGTNTHPFYGSFDGNDAVFNLAIDRTEDYNGLFGYFGIGTIKNLSVTGSVKGGSYTAGIVGYQASGTIERVYNLANVEGESFVGGISGRTQYGNIRESYNNGDIKGSASYVGGITGYIYGSTNASLRVNITNTYNRGEILGNQYVGGLVGYERYSYRDYLSIISYSYSAGLVSGNSNVGGVIGYYNTSGYNYNRQTHIYYDASVLVSYDEPLKLKPSTTIGGFALSKTDMIEEGMIDRGFSSAIWTFNPIEGNYAYYPQIKYFAGHDIERVQSQSLLSVRTNPFLGDGTEESPFLIRTNQDMVNLSKSISEEFNALDVYYLVEEGVSFFDLVGTDFVPIGTQAIPFKGHFDGNYATFNIELTGTNYLGLFGHLSSESTIKRLGVTGSVTGQDYLGSIAGYSQAKISEVYSKAIVSGQTYVGGLIGYQTSSLDYAYHTNDVTGTTYVGGLVGYNSGSILEAYVGARIIGKAHVGALVGFEAGTTNKAYYDETIIAFHEHTESEKPSSAFGNIDNLEQARGYDKEYMKGLNILGIEENQLHLSTDIWTEEDTSGLYDFYPQLKSFRNHINTSIQQASQMSARTIRFAHGSGSKSNPYIIRDADDMMAISEITKQENLYNIYFKVADGISSIDLSSTDLGYTPIGSSSSRPFRGGFDGNGTSFILNLTPRSHYRGLFGYLMEGAEIRNLEVRGFVNGYNYVGGVVGYAQDAIIENVRNYAEITGYDYIGGIAGAIKNTKINYVYNNESVSGDRHYVGGITGHSTSSEISYAYNFGDISGNAHIGGIVGRSEPNTLISYVYNRSSVIGSGNYVGGITGYLNGSTLDQAYSASIVRGANEAYIGGLIGRVNGVTLETNAYYDETIIEADDRSAQAKPSQAIANKLNYDLVRGVSKSELIGNNQLSFDTSNWVFIPTNGIDSYYPQLTYFSESLEGYVKDESVLSVRTYVFAGEGIEDSPYIIINEEDMVLLSSLVSQGTSFNQTYFRVRKDAYELNMGLNGLNYQPIGTLEHPFDGHFNGSQTNFKMNISSTDAYKGLFGVVSSQGLIENLSVSGSLEGQNYLGSVVGLNLGLVQNVYSTAKITGHDYVGGLVGSNQGMVKQVYINGQVIGNDYVGGLIGYNEGDLVNAYAVSKTYGQNHIGGLIGFETEGGYASFVYYNESIVDIYDLEGFNKPLFAISNKDESENIRGEAIEVMTSGALGSQMNQMYFDDLTAWNARDPFGFNLFYPQLSVFTESEHEVIRQMSLDSVKIDRFTEGDGSMDDPYVIRTASDMKGISDLILAKDDLQGMYFIVADDVHVIDLTEDGLNYIPIGNGSYKFQGHFDGHGVRFIQNISSDAYYQGLFGYIGENGLVKNLSVEGSVYTGTRFAGGIAGRNEGHILNVYNLADVSANDYYAGGITGYNSGVIEYTYNTGHIQVLRYRHAGGISGYMTRNALIQYSYNTGRVDVDDYYAGGIVGYNNGNVIQTYNAGIITGGHAGAIVGANTQYASTNQSYYDRSVFLFSEIDRTASRAVGNQEDNESNFGVNTSQFTGDDLYNITLDFDAFILKQNIGYDAYYPQLKVFNQSHVDFIKEDSLESVSTKLFNGQGTDVDPYLIIDRFDMKALSVLLLQGVETDNTYFKVYGEHTKIDLNDSDLYFTPIGTKEYGFSGHFLGNDSVINLAIENEDDLQALFGVLSSDASIKDLTLTGYVIANDSVGALVAENNGYIENVISYVDVTGNNLVGGLIGVNHGSIYASASKGLVKGNNKVGGLTAINEGSIELTYHFGDVSSSGEMTGGLVGFNGLSGFIISSYNHGNIVSDYVYTGGLVGYNSGSIEKAYHTGNIQSHSNYASGIAAFNDGIIKDVFAAGKVYAVSNAAGIVVENQGLIDNAYYDESKILDSKALSGLVKPTSAIHGLSDTNNIKALSHEEMTGLYSIGTYDHQMHFDYDEWTERNGYDFVTYYPELNDFQLLTNETMVEDSVLSITSRKIEGEGSQDQPYLIYDEEDILTLKTFVENEHTFEGKYFKVVDGVSTLDLSNLEEAFTPIGTTQFHFGGILDGNGVNIVLNMNQPMDEYIGLFHTLGSSALIKNIEISGSLVGQSYVGSIAGRNMGTIDQVINYASISSVDGNDIGGIVGYNEGTIKNATNKGQVTMNGTYAGGITGQNSGTITDAYNKADITGNTSIGGIVGRNLNTIKYTYNTANITGLNVIGGIAGDNISRIDHSFNHGDILAKVSTAGGIVGSMHQSSSSAEIIIAYNTGHIRSETRLSGGIVGHFEAGRIYDTYSGGTVEALSDFGAIIGQQLGGTITRSYYDFNALDHFETDLNKPEKAIGNQDDSDTVKGLYRSQMAGPNSIGTHTTQMNFYYGGQFLPTPSYDEWSFFPQIKAFTESENAEVVSDSLESVRGKTFVLGSGSKEDPYIIANESDLIALAETTNSGNDYTGIYLKVSDDVKILDFTNTDIYKYIAIGDEDNPFNGHFDGNGTHIKLYINENKNYQGLFGYMQGSAYVGNVSVSGDIIANDYTGAIAGYNLGMIENVYNQATIKGHDYTAGLIGYHLGTLKNAYNHGEIIGNQYVGGIAGYVDSDINYTYNTGVIYGKNDVGALVGFLNRELVTHSYYDTRILGAYRSYSNLIKPEQAVGNSTNSDTVKGLDKNFMTGTSVFGSGDFSMDFLDVLDVWTTSYNIDDESFYPQLKIFSRSTSDEVKALSKESAQTRLYKIFYDYRGATADDDIVYTYAMDGYHYQSPVGFKFGFEFTGWYFEDDVLNTYKYTNADGLSLNVFNASEDISLFATWEVAEHKVEFIDGNGLVIDSLIVDHGDIVSETSIIPEKNPSRTSVFFYDGWDFDFSQMILEPTKIYANYIEKDRYYKVTYLDGDGEFFKEVKVEYGQTTEAVTDIPRKTYIDDIAYKFTGWDFDFSTEITEDKNIQSTFTEVDRYYTVRFYDGNDQVIDTQTVEYLDRALIPNIKVSKDPSVSHTYDFIGFEETYLSIEEDTDVYPVFNEEIRMYTITFMDGNGEIFSTQEVAYGESAAEPSGLPRKNAHDEIAYKFIGWNLSYQAVEDNLIIMAQFEEVDRYYDVTFLNGDGQVMTSQVVEYLDEAIGPDEIPSKEMTVSHIYEFISWDQDYTMIESDLILHPVFDEQLRPYTVTFMDGNGEVFETQEVLYGQDALRPEGIPRKAGHDEVGYKFTEWSDYKNITSDRLVTSSFTPVDRYYIVTFYSHDGNTILSSQKVEYGYGASAPVPPMREHANINYEYVFLGWNQSFDFVESNLNVYAQYESRLKTFNVTFINGDETTTQVVSYGQSASAPTPYKTGNDQITYKFIEWDNDFSSVTEDIVVTAIFQAEFEYYTVNFYNGDGSIMSSQQVVPGQDAIEPSDSPIKAKTMDSIYLFTQWDKLFKEVDSNLDIYPIFNEVDRYYTVNFYNENDVLISSQTIEYGEDAIEPQKPSKEQTEQYTYTFSAWTESYHYVNKNLDIYPVYDQTLRQYTVTFIDGNDQVIETQVVDYGRSAIAPSQATKTHTDDIYYIFDGWDQSFASIKSDIIVKAVFREVNRYYTVTFYDQYHQVLDEQTIEYLQDAIDPIKTLPFEVIDDDFIYAIVGWDQSFNSVTKDLDIYAVYDTVDRYYDVLFYHEDGTLLSSQVVEYGHGAIQPDDPIKYPNDTYRYDFIGWDKAFDFINKDLTITAQFNETLTKFDVIFYDGDGHVFDQQVVNYGESATTPDGIPGKSPTTNLMYVFKGWNIDYNEVTDHLEVHAEFDEVVRTFLVRFVDEFGNLLKEEYVPYSEAATPPSHFDIPESTDQYDFLPYWDRDFENVYENMEVTLLFEEKLRSYTYTFYDEFGDIIKTVTAEYGSIITPPMAPNKAMTDKYTYEFIGWSPFIALELTGDVEYYPEFEESLRLYTVTYIDGNGDIFDQVEVPYGERAPLPEAIPSKESTIQYYYEFTYWQVVPVSVKRDMEIPALFNRFLQEYKVTFIDEDGNILKQQMVEYGTGATEPEESLVPDKADTHEYTYTFAGWSRPFGNVTEDMIVQTVYIGVLRTYTYTFYDDDQVTILKQVRAPYGAKIIVPDSPTKASTEYINYEFIGWDKVVSETLTRDISYYAKYEEHGRTYNVIFYDGNGSVYEIQEVTYGHNAQIPSPVPSKNHDSIYEYVFKGWVEDFTNITDDLKVYPIFEPKLRTFDVTFIHHDGSETVVSVEYGQSADTKVATPYRDGYRFDKWDTDVTYITEDTTAYAKYIANNYNINFLGGDNVAGTMDSVIATYDSVIDIPENSFTKAGYYFAGWKLNPEDDQVIYLDQDKLKLQDEGLDLYAEWIPIVYSINYLLDGGQAVNPSKYTIEDEVVLQAASKDDYKFLGWYVVEVIDNADGTTTTTYETLIEGEVVQVIDPGHIGNITLQAIYQYDGYIQLKEESTLGLFYADVETTIPIFERVEYNEENPVYLMGVFLNQTIGNLKENFINDNLVFIDKDGNELPDDEVVATGYQIIIRDEEDETMVKDRIHIVLKGDTSGDGRITAVDTNMFKNHINGSGQMFASKVLAGDLNDDGRITAVDLNIIKKHINGSLLIYDPSVDTTLGGVQ